MACIWSGSPPVHRVTAVAALHEPPTLYTGGSDGSIIWWNLNSSLVKPVIEVPLIACASFYKFRFFKLHFCSFACALRNRMNALNLWCFWLNLLCFLALKVKWMIQSSSIYGFCWEFLALILMCGFMRRRKLVRRYYLVSLLRNM